MLPRSLVALLLLSAPLQAALIHVPGAGAPVTRPAFQAMMAGQLAEYRALPPAMALQRLETLAALPSAQMPALAAERAAATAALALIVSPNAPALTQDRETRIVMARALGKENVAAIAAAASELKTFTQFDPALSASVARLRERFAPPAGSQRTDIGDVAGRLKEFFDQGKTPGYKSVGLGDAVDGRSILIPDRPSGLVKAPKQQGSGLLTQATPEGTGFVTSETLEDGRVSRRKIYPQDGVTLERRAVPSIDEGVYEELPGGALKQKKLDPLVNRLAKAKVDLWTVAPGPAEASKAAAAKLYAELGGDNWARATAAGLQKPLVLLVGPDEESRRTARAFGELLDFKSRSFKGARLYEAHREKALRGMAYGAFEGMSDEKKAALAAWTEFESGRDFLDRLPGGESRMDVLVRQQGLLRRAAKDFAGRQIVTFGSPEAASAQQTVFGLTPADKKDGALLAQPVPPAEPLRLSIAGAVVFGG